MTGHWSPDSGSAAGRLPVDGRPTAPTAEPTWLPAEPVPVAPPAAIPGAKQADDRVELPGVPAQPSPDSGVPPSSAASPASVVSEDGAAESIATVETLAAEDGPRTEGIDGATLEVLGEAVTELRIALDASRRTQQHQRELLDKLHDERQTLREADQRRSRDPVVRELIQASDTFLRTGRQWRARTDVARETVEQVHRVLADAADDVRLILERQGVERFAPEPGEKFDRTVAKASGSRTTEDPGKDGLIAEILKDGYRQDDRVIRFAEVITLRFVAPDAGQQGRAEA